MRVLVTGASGQVGSAVAARFQEFATVVVTDRHDLDLEKPDLIATKLSGIVPELIINAAAYTKVDLAETERDRAFRANAEGPGAMARWAAQQGVPLIHISTDYVFDGSGERPWRESDPPRPLNVYGESKLAGERAVLAHAGAALIVRTSWVYSSVGHNFLLTMNRLMREREEPAVVIDQTGAPTSAEFIATTLAEIVGPDAGRLPARFQSAGPVINVAAAGTTTWHEFALAILAGLKARGVTVVTQRIRKIATSEYEAKAKRPLNSRLDLSRLANLIGHTPPLWDVLLDAELDRVVAKFGI